MGGAFLGLVDADVVLSTGEGWHQSGGVVAGGGGEAFGWGGEGFLAVVKGLLRWWRVMVFAFGGCVDGNLVGWWRWSNNFWWRKRVAGGIEVRGGGSLKVVRRS